MLGKKFKIEYGERGIEAVIEKSSEKIAADSIFAYGFDGENLGLTLLCSCIFGDLRTEPLDEKRLYIRETGLKR